MKQSGFPYSFLSAHAGQGTGHVFGGGVQWNWDREWRGQVGRKMLSPLAFPFRSTLSGPFASECVTSTSACKQHINCDLIMTRHCKFHVSMQMNVTGPINPHRMDSSPCFCFVCLFPLLEDVGGELRSAFLRNFVCPS